MKLVLNNLVIGTCFCFVGYLSRRAIATTTPTIMAATSSSTPSSASDTYTPGTHSVAFVTTPDEVIAKKLAHAIVTKKLAACVNIIPKITSIYEWEGAINEDNEVLMMIKTRTIKIDELSAFVKNNHPYSVAEVISLPIENGNHPYLDWLSKTVPEKK